MTQDEETEMGQEVGLGEDTAWPSDELPANTAKSNSDDINEAQSIGRGHWDTPEEKQVSGIQVCLSNDDKDDDDKNTAGNINKDVATEQASDDDDDESASDHLVTPKEAANQNDNHLHHTTRGSFDLPEDGIDFLDDKIGHQTYSRRLAMYLSQQFSWYNPQLKINHKQQQSEAESEQDEQTGKKKPSIAKAWAYFEHVTLNRYEVPHGHRTVSSLQLGGDSRSRGCIEKFVYNLCRGERSLEMAEPGENKIPTKLYNPIHTPMSQLGDFGLGYGLYFSTLRAFAFLSLITAVISIPNLMYFGSEEYSPGKDLSPFLQGSAICTDRTWVACPDCRWWGFYYSAYPVDRYLWAFDTLDDNATGTWLDMENYIQIDVDNVLQYTNESLAQLYEDYQIRYTPFTEESASTLTLEGYGRPYECADTWDCFWELFFCDSEECHLFLNLTKAMNLTREQEESDDITSLLPTYGDSEQFHFAERLNCDGATRQQAAVNLATILFFIVGVFGIRWRQETMAVKFDEDEQTAQDYSINVLNPPHDAHDPDEWKEFFESNFEDCHVTVATVDMDNDDILKLFIERRNLLRRLELALPVGTPLDIKSLETQAAKAEETKQGCLSRFISPSIPNLVTRLKEVVEEIRVELKKEIDYPVTNIFVTFETEQSQREVLSTLTVGTLAAHNNDTTVLPDPKYLFRGKYVLEVDEPEEPNSIRWQELNATKTEIVTRLIMTSIMTAILLMVGVTIIFILYQIGPFWASTVTTVFTSSFPMIAKALTPYEYHRSESSRQKWMFIKIASFNIALTTVLLALITPFLATLDQREGSVPGLIPAVHGLFYSQIVYGWLFQLADPFGHLNRHFFAPRAKTQEAMNMKMRGSAVYLADRYANLVKYIYLMLWYCAVYPGAFFMGSVGLFVVYFTDRFSLMRTWARTPQVGKQIAEFARNYFTPVAIALMAVMSAYFWSGFPYDNLCEDDDTTLDPNYVGNWTIRFQGSDQSVFGLTLYDEPDVNVSISIQPDAQVYKFCQQDMRAIAGRSFPPLPKWQLEGCEWMTPQQEDALTIVAWVSVVILGVVTLSFLYRIINVILLLFSKTYEPVGEDMKRDYSKLRSIDCYVPQKQSKLFAYPLLLCDLKDIDSKLFSWHDPNKPHSAYSVFYDIKDVIDPNEVHIKHVFSDVKHWPAK